MVSFHADPRGPRVTILAVLPVERREGRHSGDARPLVLSCGHTHYFNPTFHYREGDEVRCSDCYAEAVESKR